jgi:CDP-diglyceride synthetase
LAELLSEFSVIPFVGALNACCCLWALVGGTLASNLYIKSSPVPAKTGDGAAIGAIAGLIGGVISIVLGIPINLATGPIEMRLLLDLVQNVDPRQAEVLRTQFEASGSSVASVVITSLVLAALLFVFTIIGGLIGVALFEKRKGPAAPPPPPFPGGASEGYPG